jgi:SRSO17 transposase
MHEHLIHNQVNARRFLQDYQSAFTTRVDGSSWPKWERTWTNATQYFRGLLRPGRRKSITGLAKRMDTDQEQLERFVRESPWEHENVETHLREQAPAAVQASTAALIVDSVGFPKKGTHSVGVGRQWCGVLGKIDNCQVVVNLVLATPGEQRNADQVTWPMGMQLSLPKKWAGDDDSVYDDQEEREWYARLRQEAGVPEESGYRPEYTIATDLIDQAREAVDHACVIADTNYGKCGPFRKQLRDWEEPYVVEIDTSRMYFISPETELLEPGPTPGLGPARKYVGFSDGVDTDTVEEIANRVDADEAWKRVEWAEGTKGTLSGSFFRQRVRVVTHVQNRWVEETDSWLLLEKEQPADGKETVKAWLCWDLDDASLDQLVSWAHTRWTIEQFHRDIKQVLGADEFQGRTWKGFHHHLAVVMLAQAFVAEQRLLTDDDGTGLDSFEEVVRRLVREAAIQRLIDNHGFNRQTAEEVAVDMLRGFSEWE